MFLSIVILSEQEQIKQTYQTLCQYSGATKINKPSFIQFFVNYVDPIISDRLWLIFDTKYDGFLDFEEWSTGLAILIRGNREDRIKCMFGLNYILLICIKK